MQIAPIGEEMCPPMFIATWDAVRGVKVRDTYPIPFPYDGENLCTQIFLTIGMMTEGSEAPSQKMTMYTLNIGRYERKARVRLQSGDRKILVGILAPDFFLEDQLRLFDAQLTAILDRSRDLTSRSEHLLSTFAPQVGKIFTLEQNIQNSEIPVEANYDLIKAGRDLQQGLIHFKEGNLTKAYFLLQKAGRFFEFSKQSKLATETTYVIATILTQQKKFPAAQQQFTNLINYAENLQNQKYLEQGRFMAGFCAFNRQLYKDAFDYFKALLNSPINFVDLMQFHYFLGQVLIHLDQLNDAIMHFQEALKSKDTPETSDISKKILAQTLQSLGLAHYQLIAQKLREGSLPNVFIQNNLEKAIGYYKAAADSWLQVGEFSQAILVLTLVGNYYGVLGETSQLFESYQQALDLADKSNNIPQKFQIFQRIIQKEAELGLHEQLVRRIDLFLGYIGTHAYVDIATIGKLHSQLGSSLICLGKVQDALSEFLIGLNLFRKVGGLEREQIFVLQAMIAIYKNREEPDFVTYYSDQLQEISLQIKQKQPNKQRAVGGSNGIVKEIWIFQRSGQEIFKYAHETQFDGELLGGFLLAFQNFSKEVTSHQLKAMTIGSEYYALYSDSTLPFFIMGRASVTAVPGDVEIALQTIGQKFASSFQEELKISGGELTPYQAFSQIIEKIEIET